MHDSLTKHAAQTAQEGATMKHELDLLRALADRGGLKLDIVALPFITDVDAIFGGKPPRNEPEYKNHLRIGGVKALMDGSPQGRTAAFTTPYLTDGPAGQKQWRGDLTFPQATLNEMVKKVYDGGATLFVHCNGDAAIDALLEAHRFASGGEPEKPRGTVGVHSQFIRRDQLEKYKAWGITPSFFTIHCFYFGDTHIANRGRVQADFISPMKSARVQPVDGRRRGAWRARLFRNKVEHDETPPCKSLPACPVRASDSR